MNISQVAKQIKIKDYDGLHNILTVVAPSVSLAFTFDLTFVDEGKVYFGLSGSDDEEDVKIEKWGSIQRDEFLHVCKVSLASAAPIFNSLLIEVNEITSILQGSGNLKKFGFVR